MEITASELLKKAQAFVEKKENLELATHYFNKLYNETLNGHGDEFVYLFFIASVNLYQDHNAMAIHLFKAAISIKNDFMEAINNLGLAYKKVGKTEESKKCFEEAAALVEPLLKKGVKIPEKDQADYFINLGSAYISNGTPKIAIDYLNKAEKIYPDIDACKWNRALANLELGNYKEGFSEYDFGERILASENRNYGREDLPHWDGTPGKSLVIYGEQGIGDEIMFASMLPDVLKDCDILLDAHPRLADLFRLNFPALPVYGTRKETCSKIAWSKYHKIDAKLSIGSLGKFYRKKEEDFPKQSYLVANPEMTKKYKEKLGLMGENPKIGISWKGGTISTGKNNRFIPLELWLDILKTEGIDFISLQYDKNIEKEVKEFEEKNNVRLNHWSDTLADYDETAGLVSNLDLIISVPQSVVHLAGALGTHVFQLTPYKAMWQMGPYGKDIPWYSCVRNIWQDDKCKWEPVMKKAKEELCNLLQMITRK